MRITNVTHPLVVLHADISEMLAWRDSLNTLVRAARFARSSPSTICAPEGFFLSLLCLRVDGLFHRVSFRLVTPPPT